MKRNKGEKNHQCAVGGTNISTSFWVQLVRAAPYVQDSYQIQR
jgi:hypothetical protein